MTARRVYDVSIISQMQAAHVLYVTGYEGGREPGNFHTRLIEAALVADQGNLALLLTGFPGVITAVKVYKEMTGGVRILESIASGKPPTWDD